MIANKVRIDIPHMFLSADAIMITLDNGLYVLKSLEEEMLTLGSWEQWSPAL
jgi:hypothetical protein